MFDGFYGGMGAGWWILMPLLWVALLAVVVWAVARIVPRRSDDAREPRHSREEPLEILDRRLASGEIDMKTYEQLRSRLTSRPAAGTG